MTKGPKPQATKLKLLRGNPGKRPLPKNEPQPQLGTPDRDEHLSPAAQVEWDETVRELDGLGILARADKGILAGYAQSRADWHDCLAFLQQNGSVITLRDDKGNVKWIQEAPQARLALKYLEKVRQFAAELGLSPSSRTRIHAQPPEKQNSIEEFLYGSKK